eukprot:11080695-Ditylum_brightwellii.AAC.1
MLEERPKLSKPSTTTDIETIIKNIRQREEVRNAFRLIRPITKGNQAGSVTTLLVPVPVITSRAYDEVTEGLKFKPTWKEIAEEDDIITRLISRNKLHLHQAWATPMASEPLKEYIRDFVLGSGAEDIMSGNYRGDKAEDQPA